MRWRTWVPIVATLTACAEPPEPRPAPTITVVAELDDGVELGRPVAGVEVLFYDASGAVTASVTTDADGVATAVAAEGAAVTIVHADHRETFLGLSPGDEITAHVNPDVDADGTQEVELVMASRPSEGARYFYWTPCGDGRTTSLMPSVVLELPGACLRHGRRALVYTEDAAGRALTYADVPEFELDASGHTTVTMSAWSRSWKTTAIELVGGTDDITRVSAQAVPVVAGQSLWVGLPGPPPQDYAPGDTFVATSSVPAIVDDVWYIVRAWYGEETAWFVDAGPFEETVRFDLSRLLPHVTSATLDMTKPRRPCVSFSPVTADADGVVVSFLFADSSIFFWNVLAPADHTGPICAPEVPAFDGSVFGVDVDVVRASYFADSHARAEGGGVRYFATGAAAPWSVGISTHRLRNL